jgi:hypothetical protein
MLYYTIRGRLAHTYSHTIAGSFQIQQEKSLKYKCAAYITPEFEPFLCHERNFSIRNFDFFRSENLYYLAVKQPLLPPTNSSDLLVLSPCCELYQLNTGIRQFQKGWADKYDDYNIRCVKF